MKHVDCEIIMGKKDTKKIYKHKLLASTLTCLFLMPQVVSLEAMATDITGVKPDIDGHTYNIRPDGFHGDVGFKKYENFNVSQGDVVNMIFQYFQSGGSVDANGITHMFKTQDVKTFVNLVQNQININGVLNALQSDGGALSNGHLVFVSPNGMVVGASGVLNVGSLSVYTPDSNSFNKFYNSVETAAQTIAKDGVTNATWDPGALTIDGQAVVTVDGKIMAQGDINVDAGVVNVGEDAVIAAGVDNGGESFQASKIQAVFENGKPVNKVVETYDPHAQADALFDKLVNTDNMNVANEFSAANGNIVIKASNGITTGAGSNIANYSHGDINLTNSTGNGISLAGRLANQTGDINITNHGEKGIDVASSGDIINADGKLAMTNTGAGGIDIMGNVTTHSGGTVIVTNSDSDVTIGDNTDNNNYVNSDGKVTINVDNGDLLNFGVAKTLIKTNNDADLNINVTNGANGEEVGPYDGGVCKGI